MDTLTTDNLRAKAAQLLKIMPATVTASLLLILAFIGMAWLSLRQLQGYNTLAFDLGTMSQAIWSAGNGDPLISTSQGIPLSRLARHMELIYFVLAPIYKIFPSPATLLILQAGVYSAAGISVYRLARRKLNNDLVAIAIIAVYLFYPVAQTAVLFEFHADVLAMAFIIFAIEAADRKAWLQYSIWLFLALGSKLYVAYAVVLLGAVLWLLGRKRAGSYTVLAALFWGLIALLIIKPIFAPGDIAIAESVYATLGSYIQRYFSTDFYTFPQTRLANAMVVLVPALVFLGRWAPIWSLAAVAMAVPVLLSNGPGPSYDFRYHHYALVVPFLIAGIIFGAHKLQKKQAIQNDSNKRIIKWPILVYSTLFITLFFSITLVDTPLNPQFYFAEYGSGRGLAAMYSVSDRDGLRSEWVQMQIPNDASVAADRLSALSLTNRENIYVSHMLKARNLEEIIDEVEFVMSDSLFDFAIGRDGITY